MSDGEHSYAGAGNEIIHLYILILLTLMQYKTMNHKIMNEGQIVNWDPDSEKVPTLTCLLLASWGKIYHKGTVWEIIHYPVLWYYNVQDVVSLSHGPCTRWSYPYKIFSVFRKFWMQPGAEPWINTKISVLAPFPCGDTTLYC